MKRLKLLALILSFLGFSGVSSKPGPAVGSQCGYQSCHPVDSAKINVHLIPHSHDDVGWLKTVDQYFYGNNMRYQRASVQLIIDSVVQALQEDPNRRFIQVETAFFWQWWRQQNHQTRTIFRELVDTGRLEIIGGAWSMNDEASTNYQSIIDQFTLGLRTIKDTLGDCGRPKIGWQIDPFGHTREMASIFSQLGYDGVLFTRLDYRDVAKRQQEKNTELIWRGSPDLGEVSDLFTSLIYRFYNAPDTFCWDVLCGDTPMIEDEESPDYNIPQRVNQFAEYIDGQRDKYRTPNILITMGGDFTYQQAHMYFKNMDKLIKGFQRFRPEYNLIYSTPSCYVKAVNDYATANNFDYQLKTDDFIPYASGAHTYWSGYYTSRPNSKRFEREGNNLLQVMKQLISFGLMKGEDFQRDLTNLMEIMGIMQHHDAITGTEKQHVANDYVRMITKGVRGAQANVGQIIHKLLARNKDGPAPMVLPFSTCLLANVSSCEQSRKREFVVAVYNPLAREVSHYIRLPVDSINFRVLGPEGSEVTYQVSPSINASDVHPGVNHTDYELTFRAESLPPLGLKYYYIYKTDNVTGAPDLVPPVPDLYKLGTDAAGFEISPTTGLLSTVTLNGATIPVRQEFLFYTGANGTNVGDVNRASGAYIFRPSPDSPNALPITDKATVKVYTGPLFDEVHQQFNSWTKQIIRIYKQENHLEFDWVVGPIEYINELGVEVISRFTTDLKSNLTFYTDSNGRGLIKRVRDHRETFEYTNEEPVSGNYYPVTSRIMIEEEERGLQFAILNDRSQGGSSLEDGQVELMVHRRLRNDDAFGVGEVLNEMEFGRGVAVRGHHYLVLGTPEGRTGAAQQHDLVLRKLLAPWTFVTNAEDHPYATLAQSIRFQFPGILRSLPENAHILTLEPWTPYSFLLRLEHVFQKDEDPELSEPVTVDLEGLFTFFKITGITEMTLGANQPIQENERLKWRTAASKQGGGEAKEWGKTEKAVEDLKIELNPMEIRTFIIQVEAEDKTPPEQSENTDDEDDDDGAGNVNNPPLLLVMLLVLAVSWLMR